jgi:hypothetical protein
MDQEHRRSYQRPSLTCRSTSFSSAWVIVRHLYLYYKARASHAPLVLAKEITDGIQSGYRDPPVSSLRYLSLKRMLDYIPFHPDGVLRGNIPRPLLEVQEINTQRPRSYGRFLSSSLVNEQSQPVLCSSELVFLALLGGQSTLVALSRAARVL